VQPTLQSLLLHEAVPSSVDLHRSCGVPSMLLMPVYVHCHVAFWVTGV
jgi:hypothetical protein